MITLKLAEDKLKFDEYEERYSDLDKRIHASKSRRGLLLKEISINKGLVCKRQPLQMWLRI